MVENVQWVMLPYHVVWRLPGLRLSPIGVKLDRDRQQRWSGKYILNTINTNNLPLLKLTSMKYGRALDRFLQQKYTRIQP